MSIQAVAWVLDQNISDAAAKLVLISLANALNGRTGRCFPTIETICSESSCSKSTALRKLKWLEGEGWISINSEFGADGRQLANSYTLGCQIDTPRVSTRHGEGFTRDTPEGVSCDTPTKEPEEIPEGSILSETSSDETRKEKKRITYPDAFEALWKAYPVHQNMSKKEAFDAWTKLDDEDRTAVFNAVPGYKAFLSTKPDLETVHLCRFISKCRFDGYVAAPQQAATPKHVTTEDWQKRLGYARQQRRWSVQAWGPMPQTDGSCVPAELLEPEDGRGWATI